VERRLERYENLRTGILRVAGSSQAHAITWSTRTSCVLGLAATRFRLCGLWVKDIWPEVLNATVSFTRPISRASGVFFLQYCSQNGCETQVRKQLFDARTSTASLITDSRSWTMKRRFGQRRVRVKDCESTPPEKSTSSEPLGRFSQAYSADSVSRIRRDLQASSMTEP
jgi:hypothetical protein